MAIYLALTDLYLPGDRFIQAGTTFSDTGPGALVPSSWPPPTNGVSPQDPDATSKYWAVGPRGMLDAEPNKATYTNCQRWSNLFVPAATTRWIPVNPTKPWLGFQLSGAGNNLGPRPPM